MKHLQDGIPYLSLVGIGAFIILCGVMHPDLWLYLGALKTAKRTEIHTGDPWNGRTLEWSIPSPPPIYNFAIIPTVDQLDPLWAIKRGQAPKPQKRL